MNNSRFYDYRTKPVNGNQVVDPTKTGMSFYDDFLSDDLKTIEYLKNKKNLVGNIVMMSPEEYFEGCSKYGFPNKHPSVAKLKQERANDVETINHLKDVLTVAKSTFPIPVLNKAQTGQEGLHRMFVIGEMFGWNHKVPVLVVDWADKDRAEQDMYRSKVRKLEQSIESAIRKTLMYRFANTEELKEQLQFELDKVFEYNDDIQIPVEFELQETNSDFIVHVGDANVEFSKENVQFIDTDQSDETSMDDLDIDDEDFLVRYFGDNWRKTVPHLKDKFNITESFDSNDINDMHNAIIAEFGYNTPEEGCIFIAPDGTFINIYPQLDDHEDLCYWLEENGFEDNPEDASWFVNEFNYIRCRNSMHLCFIDLPKTCTVKQFYSLEEWLETKVRASTLQVSVSDGQWKEYDLNNYFPEDIMSLIKRYYSSGKLYD